MLTANVSSRPRQVLPGLRPTVSVVIPRSTRSATCRWCCRASPPGCHEVILVDGARSDATIEVARRCWPGVRIVGQTRPGKGAALQAGFRAAVGDIIVTLDADGSTDPAEIPLFVSAPRQRRRLRQGVALPPGRRHRRHGPPAPVGQLGVCAALVRAAFGGRYSDLCYGYNAFWRRVLPVIDGDADGFEIETLMNVRVLAAGLRVAEVPSHEALRIHGTSNLRTFRDGARVLRVIIARAGTARRLRRATFPAGRAD